MASITWDNTTIVDSTIVQPTNQSGAIEVSIVVSGIVTAGKLIFEVSDDGVNWFVCTGLAMSAPGIFNFWQSTFGTMALQFCVAGYPQFRLRLNPVISGTGNITINVNTCSQGFSLYTAALQSSGPNLHMTLDDAAGGVTASVSSKGTQGTNALATQDYKDSGRVMKVYSATFTGATTEALITLTPITDGAAGVTGTSFTVTAGKKFRVQAILLAVKNAGAAVQGSVVNLRMTSTGVVAANSPLIATVGAGTLSATANIVGSEAAPIPDGLEFSGTMQFGLSQVGTATAGNTVTLIGYEY